MYTIDQFLVKTYMRDSDINKLDYKSADVRIPDFSQKIKLEFSHYFFPADHTDSPFHGEKIKSLIFTL
jgi:hypothetical protein